MKIFFFIKIKKIMRNFSQNVKRHPRKGLNYPKDSNKNSIVIVKNQTSTVVERILIFFGKKPNLGEIFQKIEQKV